MSIGTSLGAYFDDEMHQHSSPYIKDGVMAPPDTGDDNILPEPNPPEALDINLS